MEKFLLLIFFLIPVNSLYAQKDFGLIILQHANIIDGISNKPIRNVTLSIANGKIINIQKHFRGPASKALIIDLAGKWLLPGYIDAHVHISSFESAQAALAAGATTIRIMGGSRFFDTTLRNAHNAGVVNLPDVVASGYQIRPDLDAAIFIDFPSLIDLKPRLSGIENVRRVVRANVEHRVDLIKVLATERSGTPQTDPNKQTFTDEELKAIVDEARKAGLAVAAHAQSDSGARAAAQAGVRSIEHGNHLSNETLKMIKARDIFLVVTSSLDTNTLRSARDTAAEVKNNPILAERRRSFSRSAKKEIANAYQMGISIVGGTDAVYTLTNGFKITQVAAVLVESGLPPMQAIKAITSRAAQCLQIADHTGAIKIGFDADIVIVGANPLKNIKALQDVQIILNDGEIIKQLKSALQ